MKRLSILTALVMGTLLSSSILLADAIQPLLDVGEETSKNDKTSQSKIDSMDDDTSLIINEFKIVFKRRNLKYKYDIVIMWVSINYKNTYKKNY